MSHKVHDIKEAEQALTSGVTDIKHAPELIEFTKVSSDFNLIFRVTEPLTGRDWGDFLFLWPKKQDDTS